MTTAEKIEGLLKKNPSMKAREIAETLSLSRSTVYGHLERRHKGGGRSRRATAVAARRRSPSRAVAVPVPIIDRITSEIDEEIAETKGYLDRLTVARDALAA